MQPTTVYTSALTNIFEAPNFYNADWIERALNKNSIYTQESSDVELLNILVSAAIATEKEDHPNDADYYVLLKALKNPGMLPYMVSS